MLHLFYGNDTEKVKAESMAFREDFEKKAERPAIFKLLPEQIEERILFEYAGMQGLFGESHLIILENFLHLEASLPSGVMALLSSSPNIFLLVEEDLVSEDVARVEQVGGKVSVFSKKSTDTKKKTEFFPIFSLADALGERDRKKLWVLFSRAISAGVSAEEIHRILFWEVKAIAQAGQGENANDAGLSPFVFTKAKRASVRFTNKDIFHLSDSLLRATHNSRQGGAELGNSLERIILSL